MLAVITSGLILATGTAAQACKCAESTTQDHLSRADIVIVGTIDGPDSLGIGKLSAATFGNPVQYDVQVKDVFKGERIGPQLAVVSEGSGGACGWEESHSGEDYLPTIDGPADADQPLIIGSLLVALVGAGALVWLRHRRRPI